MQNDKCKMLNSERDFMEFVTNSPEQTEALGAALAEVLQPGAV